jgi:hypothetical protein
MTARLVWPIALIAACSFDSEPVAFQSVDNGCIADADCPDGSCDGNICIDDTNATVEVVIEVSRSSTEAQSMTPTSWAFPSARFQGSTVRDLILPEIREVRGNVRWDGLRVPASLRFTRRTEGELDPPSGGATEIDTLREPGADGLGAPFDFSTVLVAGETYDVVVTPSSDMVMSPSDDATAPAVRALPPLYLEVAVEKGDSGTPFRFDVSFPSNLDDLCVERQSAPCSLRAKIVSFDGELPQAEPGLQVRAVDKGTGRVVSSIGQTDELGDFAIRLGEDADDYFIRVTSTAGRDPFPSVSVDPDLALADGNIVYVPRLERTRFTGQVRDEDGTPVPGASVRFSSNSIFDESQLGLEGSFAASTTTDQEGSFGTELLPGYYAVTVTPPEDATRLWGVLLAYALVGKELTVSEALIVPTRAELLGWIRTFRQEAAVGVSVLARARPEMGRPALHRSQEAVSNSLGRFAMQVDPGLYDLHVQVPAQSGYPWLVEPGLSVSETLARTYRLPPPVPIEGTVQSNDGTLVPGALIRAYVAVEDGETSRLVQVAETTSDQQGAYRLLIAPQLGAE